MGINNPSAGAVEVELKKDIDMKINICVSDELISDDDIILLLNNYIQNPYSLDKYIFNQKLKKRSKKRIIDIDNDLYNGLKSSYNNSKIKIEKIIECIITKRGDELYYGSILFKNKNLWIREKITPIGRIDGLNLIEKRIVELKYVDGFKAALGQIISYGYFYPTFQKEIWLLVDKKVSEKKKNLIKDICNKYLVKVLFFTI